MVAAVRCARYGGSTTARNEKVSVELDAEIVERTRSALGAAVESDPAVVERALNAYLLLIPDTAGLANY
jgi:hypothetical protein